jgi:nucleoside 2-deoxyribosyltransferase
MNCFVIMPFAREFDDVYATIQSAVERACKDNSLLCFRLDENRQAGRITARLVQEIESASLCIADLTGSKPNIMWEVGYAMALRKPTILAADLFTA